MEEWNWDLTISAIVAIFTGLASLFSYLAVRNASKSNKIATKQYEESVKISKQNTRPVLDVITKHYKADINEGYLSDWDTEDGEVYLPKYASQSYIELVNIGNKTARNVTVSFNYEGLDIVKQLLPDENEELFKSKLVKINVTNKFQNGDKFDEFSIFEEINTGDKRKLLRPSLFDKPYVERYGSLPPDNGNRNCTRVYLPKLFVYLNNIFVERIMKDEVKINLILKIHYTDPFQNTYQQNIRIENYIRKHTVGAKNYIIGQLIPEEIENIAIEDE